MEVGKINNNQNFGARIVVKKTGFKNLGKDFVDSSIMGSGTTGTVGSLGTETTIFPSDAVQGFTFLEKTKKIINKMAEPLERIFGRNIKTAEIEGIDTKKVAQRSGEITSGASTISTGIGSYEGALGSALDQSVHYPVTIYDKSFPEMSANHLPQSSVNHTASLVDWTYDRLWDPRELAGNECASSFSTSASGFGGLSQAIGYDILKNGSKTFSETTRNIPN